jgi:hypothetical protein
MAQLPQVPDDAQLTPLPKVPENAQLTSLPQIPDDAQLTPSSTKKGYGEAVGGGLYSGAKDFLSVIPNIVGTAYSQNISPQRAFMQQIGDQIRNMAQGQAEEDRTPEASWQGRTLHAMEHLPLVGGYVQQAESGSQPTLTEPSSNSGGYKTNYASPDALESGIRAATALAVAPKLTASIFNRIKQPSAGKPLGEVPGATKLVETPEQVAIRLQRAKLAEIEANQLTPEPIKPYEPKFKPTAKPYYAKGVPDFKSYATTSPKPVVPSKLTAPENLIKSSAGKPLGEVPGATKLVETPEQVAIRLQRAKLAEIEANQLKPKARVEGMKYAGLPYKLPKGR